MIEKKKAIYYSLTKKLSEATTQGIAKQKLNPVTKVGRVVYFGHSTENFELIPFDERLIVLAWGTREGLDPWKDQPNHIAIMKRARALP